MTFEHLEIGDWFSLNRNKNDKIFMKITGSMALIIATPDNTHSNLIGTREEMSPLRYVDYISEFNIGSDFESYGICLDGYCVKSNYSNDYMVFSSSDVNNLAKHIDKKVIIFTNSFFPNHFVINETEYL